MSNMATNRVTWQGHSETVLAVDVSSSGSAASVSEDDYCILWSHDGEIITKILIEQDDGAEKKHCVLNSVKFVPYDSNKLFVSSDDKVLGFDVRKLPCPVSRFAFNTEEINEISINDTGEYLAACDDNGEIKIIDLKKERLFKTLSRHHSNICSSVRFRPTRPWQVVTAGLDCNIIYWDYSTGKPRNIFNVNEDIKDEASQDKMFINPPFIHSLTISKDGWNFAAGLGNGNIGLFNFHGKSFHYCKTFKAHDSEVSQVTYFEEKSAFVSGGNDGNIKIWKTEAGSLCNEILHGSKINWLTCCSMSKDLILVADQSCNVHVYQMTQ